jgi:hypothetical protein
VGTCWKAYTMMKQLLLLSFLAFGFEAMAQDAQCVRECATMVETIRAYARSEADVLGPQGISERVLEAMGQTERHRFVPGGSCSVAYMDQGKSGSARTESAHPVVRTAPASARTNDPRRVRPLV